MVGQWMSLWHRRTVEPKREFRVKRVIEMELMGDASRGLDFARC